MCRLAARPEHSPGCTLTRPSPRKNRNSTSTLVLHKDLSQQGALEKVRYVGVRRLSLRDPPQPTESLRRSRSIVRGPLGISSLLGLLHLRRLFKALGKQGHLLFQLDNIR